MNHDTQKKIEVAKLICHLLMKNVIIGTIPFGHLVCVTVSKL